MGLLLVQLMPVVGDAEEGCHVGVGSPGDRVASRNVGR